ncbi:hypothetical protein [Thetidibacter halocola]|uniref:AAA+ family ATPase n=1 Tax=Thetidibacter halocola TaxID=2827239 RepID=A0A8J8BAH6_9RHOB|nr:hypothetical protein [Thetidibacter halocola]MBS0125208.1 hypothetical protein [Thetidibacter halocola]
MKLHAAFFAACLTATPLAAQDEGDQGLSLMEEGARLFFRGLMSEMEPALRELEGMADEMRPAIEDFAREMGPALRDLMGKVEDWSLYEPPEILPNGDIIIRRKPDPAPPLPEGGEEIEL